MHQLRQPLPQQLLPPFAPGSRCQTCPSAASLTQTGHGSSAQAPCQGHGAEEQRLSHCQSSDQPKVKGFQANKSPISNLRCHCNYQQLKLHSVQWFFSLLLGFLFKISVRELHILGPDASLHQTQPRAVVFSVQNPRSLENESVLLCNKVDVSNNSFLSVVLWIHRFTL